MKFNEIISQLVLKYRWFIIIAFSSAIILNIQKLEKLEFNSDYEAYFSEKNIYLEQNKMLENIYSKTDQAIIIVRSKKGDVFNINTLKAIKEINEKGWYLPYVSRVDSITNYQHSYVTNKDDLIVEDLIGDDLDNLTLKQIENIKKIALNEPSLVNLLISQDGKTSGIMLSFKLDSKTNALRTAVNAIEQLISDLQPKYPDLIIKASGGIFLNDAFLKISKHDSKTLIPIMYAVLLVILFITMRSISAFFAIILVISLSSISSLMFAVFNNITITAVSSIVPIIVLTLAVADSIHIIISAFVFMKKSVPKKEAILKALQNNLRPVFITSLTTIIGFLSLNFSDSPPFRDLGNMTAFGIFTAFIYSCLLLPALLLVLPINVNKIIDFNKFNYLWLKLLNLIFKYKIFFVFTAVILTVISLLLIPQIVTDDQSVKYFDKKVEFRQNAQYMSQNLTGIYTIQYSINSDVMKKIYHIEYLQNLEKFTNWLRSQPEISYVYSITDIIKKLNKNMHGDNQSYYKLPNDSDLVAQYLLLYEISLPYGLDLNNKININKSSSMISVVLSGLPSSKDIKNFKIKSEKWLQNNTPAYMHSYATGAPVMFSYISQNNIDAMLMGNILALILVSITISLTMFNLKIGFMSIIPNIVPIVIGYGVWAIFIKEINMITAIAGVVCFCIIVDDTVHFLNEYLRAKKRNMNTQKAIEFSILRVGTAIIISTIMLVGGFAVLTLSAFKINSYLGLFTLIVLIIAVIVDLILFPAILSIKGDKKYAKN